MRSIHSVLCMSFLVLGACATMSSAVSPSLSETGIARSVFPMYVRSPTRKDMNTETYHVASAVCVSAHAFVTSSRYFLPDLNGVTTIDIGGVRLAWDGGGFTVTDIDVIGGVAIIETEQECSPIELLNDPVSEGDRYIVAAISYGERLSRRHLPNPAWDIGGATVTRGPFADTFPELDHVDSYSVVVESAPSTPGTVLIDRSNRLAGILHWRHRGSSSVLPINAIRAALSRHMSSDASF